MLIKECGAGIMKKFICIIFMLFLLVACGKYIQQEALISEPISSSSLAEEQVDEFSETSEQSDEQKNSKLPEKDGLDYDLKGQQPDKVEFYEDESGRGFFDPDGNKVLLSDKYDYFFNFYDGRMVVFNKFSEEDLKNIPYYFTYIGVIDMYGKVVVDFGEYMHDSREGSENYHYENGGLIVTLLPTENDKTVGVINTEGEYILEPAYRSISREIISNRRLILEKTEALIKYGYLDENYNIVIPCEYDQANSFIEDEIYASAIVFKMNMNLYDENSMDLPENHLFNYRIIDTDNNVLYEEDYLIYCDLFTYRDAFRANSLDMVKTDSFRSFTYVVLEKSTMKKETINFNTMWTNNYEASFYVENPQ